MKPTHCIMYMPVDRMDRVETKGGCLDYHDPDGNVLLCRVAIEKGYCCKNRKTPVI
jgi:hypothetical protein